MRLCDSLRVHPRPLALRDVDDGALDLRIFFQEMFAKTESKSLDLGPELLLREQDPGLYLPWIAKGFELMFRDAARWNFTERGPGTAVLEVRGLPPECFTDSVWAESVASALCALLDSTQLEGQSPVRSIEAEAGLLTFQGRWKAR